MPRGLEHAIREPDTRTPADYARRARLLATSYAVLLVASLAGICLILARAQLFVRLTQRSNVETLTLAFFLIFFAYTAVLSAGGAAGAARIAFFAAQVWRGADPLEVERRKAAALGPPRDDAATVALNMAVCRDGQGGDPFSLAVADTAGSAGTIEIHGVEMVHRHALRTASNSLLAFIVQQIVEVLAARDLRADLDIVQWKTLDDEETNQYLAMARFACNLERHLGAGELWPRLTLTEADCRELERRLTAICPALRDEAFLPQWEFAGEHKLPLIPEPLGLISLVRSERRADPVTTIFCAVVVVVVATLLLLLVILFPPWVPGT